MITDKKIIKLADGLVFKKPNFFSSPVLSFYPMEAQALVGEFTAIVKQVTGRDLKISDLEITRSKKLGAGTIKLPFRNKARLQVSRGLIESRDAETIRGVLYHEAGHLRHYYSGSPLLKLALLFTASGHFLKSYVGFSGKIFASSSMAFGIILPTYILVSNKIERECDNVAVKNCAAGFYKAMNVVYKQRRLVRSEPLASMLGYPSTRSRIRKAQKAIIEERLASKGVKMPNQPIGRNVLMKKLTAFLQGNNRT